MQPLGDLKPGTRATVTGYTTDDPPGRLLEMGLIPGTQVECVRVAPLGDPIDFRVRGFHLSLRKSEAAHVLVEPS
ncbi:MAG: FeoA family protein [Rubricoccaceae bacterium]